MLNQDPKVVTGFGAEWASFDQTGMSRKDLESLFAQYFSIFPWEALPKGAIGFDLGCGSGRWAQLVAPRVGILHCIDASEVALAVARNNLRGLGNCRFHVADVSQMPLPDESADFGYSLGVLHHVPDSQAALSACATKLKRGAPFLLYLYYAFDNKPRWYRLIWQMSEVVRNVVSRLPFPVKYALSQAIAMAVYFPLARLALVAEKLGCNVESLPLSYYRERGFYVMRTDALDRFGTRLEKRFTRSQITLMLEAAGFVKIRFSETMPFWCVVAIRS
jgi:ubiquinone/menaquinone biosynthesis C-methylase UbiE